MKRLRCIRLFLPLLSILAACTPSAEDIPAPKEPDTVVPVARSITADAGGGDVELRFRANTAWTIHYADDRKATYGTLNAEKGSASDACGVVFTMHPNTSADAREVTFIITAGRASAEVTVRQPGLGVELPGEDEVREYLVRLFHDTDGPNWRFRGKWCSDLPIDQWGSEIKYKGGRLELILGEHYMKGKLDLSGCKALVSIRASKNKLTEVDLSDCPLLEEAYFISNSLTKINVEGCLSLRRLYVGYNMLTDISVGWCTTLIELGCENNSLTAIDLEHCVELQELQCSANGLMRLEIPHRRKLRNLWCYDNRIKSLNLRGAPFLSVVSCFNNGLESLKIEENNRLAILWCFGNRIGGEIPLWMDRISQFRYDERYEYPDDGQPAIDHGYGWWYPGEPASGHHAR